MTLSIMALSIMASTFMPSVIYSECRIFLYCYAERRYAERHYAKCRGATVTTEKGY